MTNLPISQPTSHCTYCTRPAITGDILKPPLCEKHYALVIVVEFLKRYDLPPSVEHIAAFCDLYPKTGISPAEVPELVSQMPVLHREQPIPA